MASTAACGFPSPADDYLDSPLDFNELLVQQPGRHLRRPHQRREHDRRRAVPGRRRRGRPLAHARSNGSIVLALIDGEFTIKRYCLVGGGIVLLAENPRFMNIEISAETGLEVWGVVKHAIRML